MATRTASLSHADARLAPIAALLLAGLALFSVVNYSQAAVLHDAAHDARHSLASPCH